jgi:hypothetical protein
VILAEFHCFRYGNIYLVGKLEGCNDYIAGTQLGQYQNRSNPLETIARHGSPVDPTRRATVVSGKNARTLDNSSLISYPADRHPPLNDHDSDRHRRRQPSIFERCQSGGLHRIGSMRACFDRDPSKRRHYKTRTAGSARRCVRGGLNRCHLQCPLENLV